MQSCREMGNDAQEVTMSLNLEKMGDVQIRIFPVELVTNTANEPLS